MKAQQVQADSAVQTLTVLKQTPEEKKETVTFDKLYAGMFGVMNVDSAAFANGKPTTYTSLRA